MTILDNSAKCCWAVWRISEKGADSLVLVCASKEIADLDAKSRNEGGNRYDYRVSEETCMGFK